MPQTWQRANSCKICGSTELVYYIKQGKRVSRPYCEEHYTMVRARQRKNQWDKVKDREGAVNGWRRILKKQKPTPGYDRILIDRRDKRITFYSNGLCKTQYYRKHPKLNKDEFWLGLFKYAGYKVIRHDFRTYILERPVEMRIVRRIIRGILNGRIGG